MHQENRAGSATRATASTPTSKAGSPETFKGGVIMDVVTAEQAKIAEDAGACAVMALERVPADIRKEGGVARMSPVEVIERIQKIVSIPVMAKVRIGHFLEAQVLEALGVDFIDESEVLTPADEAHHIDKRAFTVPFVCGATNIGEALRRIGALYRIERLVSGHPPEQRRAVRHEQSRPIVDDLHTWLNAQRGKVPGRSRIAEAIRYALKLWPGLVRYLDDGRIEIDSNSVERSIRPIALNRKNALFAGSDQGGTHWGVIASLIETCKLNAVDPQAWLANSLIRLVNRHPASQIDQLMPWAYPARAGVR